MLTVAVLVLFAFSVVVTSGLAYDERGWRYAMAFTTGCAIFLTWRTAELLRWLMRAPGAELGPALALVIATVPFGLVLLRLILRRINTPRHTPGPDDDPVLRRHLQEKLRRRRKRRQEEELLENSDEATGSEMNRP